MVSSVWGHKIAVLRTKKSRRFRRLLKLITGRRQTEWTGATRCPNEDADSHIRESLIDRKRGNLLRLYLPCRPLAEFSPHVAPATITLFAFYDLKKLFAASFDARFLADAASSRSISPFKSAMRSANSSTDKSDKSWPISWLIFFRGRSSSSIGIARL